MRVGGLALHVEFHTRRNVPVCFGWWGMKRGCDEVIETPAL